MGVHCEASIRVERKKRSVHRIHLQIALNN